MNGTSGKNSVENMWPTAIDPSSINSMAILIRFLKKITMIKMMKSMIAISTRKIIQVTKNIYEIISKMFSKT